MMTSLLILHIQTKFCIFPVNVSQKTSPLALGGCVMSIYLYFLWRIDWCSGVVPYISYIYCLFTHLLMLLPSFRRSPAAPVLAARSLPARSTRLSLLTFSPLVWSETTRQNADSLNVMTYNLFWTLQREKLRASCSLRRLADDSWIDLCVHLAFLSNPCFYVRSTSRFMWRCKEKATSHNFQLNTGRITQTKWTQFNIFTHFYHLNQ